MEGRGMGGIDSVGNRKIYRCYCIRYQSSTAFTSAILLSCETFLEREKRFERKKFKILGRSR